MKLLKHENSMQLHYNVDYELDGQNLTQKDIYSSNPGAAIAACQKLHPKARMIKAWIEGSQSIFGSGYQEWDAPKVQRDPVPDPKPYRPPKPNERDGIMPFYDEVR